MRINELKENMQLIIDHPHWESFKLPWDLKTIFDCELSFDDIQTLECGIPLKVGECTLLLEILPQ